MLRAVMRKCWARRGGIVVGAFVLAGVAGCGTMRSIVGLKSEGADVSAGTKLHFKVPPEEALTILSKVAPQHGWELVAVGDQFDMQGPRGKYFRLATDRFLGGRKEMNGVFFGEPEGSYVIVGKSDTGLPRDLVEPFTAAVGGQESPTETGAGVEEPVSEGPAAAEGQGDTTGTP